VTILSEAPLCSALPKTSAGGGHIRTDRDRDPRAEFGSSRSTNVAYVTLAMVDKARDGAI
jgi:hypothetical protein